MILGRSEAKEESHFPRHLSADFVGLKKVS